MRETVTNFSQNLSFPVHRWFRYPAGFSHSWVKETIGKHKRLFDPFVGSGTTLVEAELNQIESVGLESHPFVFKIAEAKLNREKIDKFPIKLESEISSESELTKRCFSEDALKFLASLRNSWKSSKKNDLSWLAITSILRECSPVGTASWQYILPNKSKSRFVNPQDAFLKKIKIIEEDNEWRNSLLCRSPAQIYNVDARNWYMSEWADIVITSPPYLNNYDYADALRLEMTFWGDVSNWSDLSKIRKDLIRSCTNQLQKEDINSKEIDPIREEINKIYHDLKEEREKHAGKKPYHDMVVSYFVDMAKVWNNLRKTCQKNCKIYFIIGDSAPYGIHVPTEELLGKLAIASGFKGFKFDKIRDRNVKWKNRKHNVPLKEGILSVT